jgi:hypothetical protein
MDNIKYDIIHIPELLDEGRICLFEKMQTIASLIVPFEYGITN